MGGTGFIPERLMMIMITGTQLLNLISIIEARVTSLLLLLLLIEAKAEITASVPAGVHWRASPEGMPLWGPSRFWPRSGLVLRCLGPGFTVLGVGLFFCIIVYYYYYYIIIIIIIIKQSVIQWTKPIFFLLLFASRFPFLSSSTKCITVYRIRSTNTNAMQMKVR